MADNFKQVKFIERCYELYEKKMYRVAYNILHDADAAEDAVQNAFVKLFKSKVVFEDECSDDCIKYIIRTIKNSAIDIYNKQSRELTDSIENFPNIPFTNSNPGDVSSLTEDIRKLPSKYREVVECLAIREMTIKDTANYLRISEANVRKRLERARKLLQKG